MTCEYIKLELCGLTIDQGVKIQDAIMELVADFGVNSQSYFVREREDECGDFFPVFSTTEGREDA
jgi:hypothetical protein